MHKLISIFSLVLLFVSITFGQAVVDFPITVSDNTGASAQIYFGLDLTATDGTDFALGEDELPGLPPGGYFAAWLFPDFTTLSYKDYRAPGNPPAFPFTGHKSYIIRIQTDIPAGNPMTISWNLPSTIATTSTIGNGANIVSFSGSGSHTWNYNPVNLLYIFVEVDFIDIVPVELTSFTASVSEGSVVLNWTTATELNNQGFEIERSKINQGWEKIGYVPGFGTSTEPKSYSFLDENIETGVYSYRLKQIDFDGTAHYSDAVEIEVDLTPNNFILFQNYPNPFNPNTTIQFQVPKVSDVTIVVYDMLGQEVKSLFSSQVQPGKYTVEWDGLNYAGAQMSSGTYIYRMTSGEFIDVKEMILLK
jgi:hypothetical protein